MPWLERRYWSGQLEGLSLASASPVVAYLFHSLAGVVGVRARVPDGPEHLERALRIFDEKRLQDDAMFLECAILSTLTLIRPHETRAKYARHVALRRAQLG